MMFLYIFNIVCSLGEEHQNCPYLVLILYAFSVIYWICRFKRFWVMTFFISRVWVWRPSNLACFCIAASETDLCHLCSVWRGVFGCLQGKNSDCRCQDGNIGFQDLKSGWCKSNPMLQGTVVTAVLRCAGGESMKPCDIWESPLKIRLTR